MMACSRMPWSGFLPRVFSPSLWLSSRARLVAARAIGVVALSIAWTSVQAQTSAPVDQPTEACRTAFLADLIPYQAEYTSRLAGLRLATTQSLSRTDQGYRLETRGRVLWRSMTEVSEFRVDHSGHLRPSTYSYDRNSRRHDHQLQFAADNHQVTAIYRDERHRLDGDSALHDPLTQQLQLQMDLACSDQSQGQPLQLAYTVARRDRLREYRFERINRTWLRTAIGWLDALQLLRTDTSGTRETRIWMAVEHFHMPVKIDYKERDGSQYRMEIESLRIGDHAIRGRASPPEQGPPATTNGDTVRVPGFDD